MAEIVLIWSACNFVAGAVMMLDTWRANRSAEKTTEQSAVAT